MRVLLTTLLGLAFGLCLPGQSMVISTTDGDSIAGELLELLGTGREANLRVAVGGESRNLPLARIVALHGPGPSSLAGPVVHLVGGDLLRGDILSGDAAGELFTLQSNTLGQLRMPIDRLRAIVFAAGRDGDLARFTLPEDSDRDEALFRPARRGYDTIVGAIERFTASGVLFELPQRPEPRLFDYDGLAALALRGGIPREGTASAQLVTRAGDVLGVDLVDARDGQLTLDLEGGHRVVLGVADVASLAFLGSDRRFLSDLEPLRVEEQGTPFEQKSPPLYHYRGDRAAAGGFLVVGGQTHPKGLGTHSRCVLTYRVPDGFTKFECRVGIDDQVLNTPVRGVAEVLVRVGGEVVWGPTAVRSGEAAQNLGVIPVKPGDLITLQVDFGEGWFLGDRVDWLSPVLLE